MIHHPLGYIVHVKTPGTAGGETRSYQLAQALGQCGAGVYLYGQVDPAFPWRDEVRPRTLMRPVPLGTAQLMRDFSRNAIDVAIERYQLPPFNPGVFAQRLRGKPIILEVHGFPIEEYTLFASNSAAAIGPLARLVGRIPPTTWERLQRSIFRWAAHIIVTSAGTKARLYQMGVPKEKVTVVYNCVDPALFQPAGRNPITCRAQFQLPEKGPLVLFAGNYSEEMGTVLAAAAEIAARRNDVGFVFAVKGMGATLREMARARGLNERQVLILPAVPHQQMPNLLAAVDVVLAPYSLGSERFRKGFHYSPLKVLEALAMEKAIVTVHAEELHAVFGRLPNLHFAESGSRQSWAAALLQAIDGRGSPELYLGRQFVMDGYRWQDAAQQYLNIVQSVEGGP